MTISIATKDDIEPIFEMLMEMHEENAHFPVNRDSVRRILMGGIEHQFCFVQKVDGEYAGTASLFINQTWYSDAKYVTDFWFFVRKKHRRLGHSDELLEACKNFAEERDLPLMIGVFTKDEPDRKVKYFSRRMEAIGGFFMCGAV